MKAPAGENKAVCGRTKSGENFDVFDQHWELRQWSDIPLKQLLYGAEPEKFGKFRNHFSGVYSWNH